MFYYEIHIIENMKKQEGFSIFFKSKKEMYLEQDIIDYAITIHEIDAEDIIYIDYAQDISKEEYLDATGGE